MGVKQDRFVGRSGRHPEPARVEVRDCTLREAEQAVGLSLEEKLRLARALHSAGVRRIQVGAPGRSPVDQQAALRLRSEGIPVSLDGLAIAYVPDWKEHVDACAACGVDTIDLVVPVSPIYLKRVLQISQKEMLDRVSGAVGYARRVGAARVAVSAMDAPRASPSALAQVGRAALEAGAEELFVCDSVGVAGPQWIGRVVGRLLARHKLRIGIHCHNDLGLAMANTLAAVEAGAAVVDVTVNGLGERSGNVSLDELAVVLGALYHLDVGVDTTRLTGLASLMSELTRVPLPFNKPLVGTWAFAHRHDTHARAAVAEPASIEPIDPTSVGNRRQFVGGKYSGPFVMGQIAKRLGLDLTEEQAKEAALRVQEFTTGNKVPLSDDAFVRLVGELVRDRTGPDAT